MADLSRIEKNVQEVIDRASKMEEERIKAQTRFDSAKADLVALGFKSLTEAKDALAALEQQVAELETEIQTRLAEIKEQLDSCAVGER